MMAHPNTTHNYNHDLVVEINALKEKRDSVSSLIEAETTKNYKLKDEVAALNKRL
jgi:hypothetical protein